MNEIGRLQLAKMEDTGYTAHDGTEVEITFRHATQGEHYRTLSDNGIKLGSGDAAARVDEDDWFIFAAKTEEANIALAKLCITKRSIDKDQIAREALAQIGKYLRDQANSAQMPGAPNETEAPTTEAA